METEEVNDSENNKDSNTENEPENEIISFLKKNKLDKIKIVIRK